VAALAPVVARLCAVAPHGRLGLGGKEAVKLARAVHSWGVVQVDTTCHPNPATSLAGIRHSW